MDDPLEFGRHVRSARRQRCHRACAHLLHDLDRIVARKGRLTRQRLVQHTPEGEDIGPAIHVVAAAGLLGRGVKRRAHGRAFVRESLGVEYPAGNAKIEDARLSEPPAHQKDVARLDVAVDDASLMRSGQRVQHAIGHVHGRRGSQRAARQALFQGLSLEPLHHDEGRSVRRRPPIEIAYDARMFQLRQEARLLIETRNLGGAPDVEHLERNHRPGPTIDRLIHRTHPTGPCLTLELKTIHEVRAALGCSRLHASGNRHEGWPA